MRVFKTLIISFVMVVSFIAVNPAVSFAQFYFVTPPQIGKPAPDFKLKDLEGKDVTLSGIRDGKRAIVFFWATWCPHCRRELKGLYDQKEALAKKNIRLAIVDLGEGANVVKRYLEKQKMEDLDVILDEEEAYAEEYGVVGLPSLFFVDEKGIIRDMQYGMPDDLEKSFATN